MSGLAPSTPQTSPAPTHKRLLPSRYLLGLTFLLLVGTATRLAYAFATYGVSYDIQSFEIIAHGLRTDPGHVYNSGRWPYPAGFFPFVALADHLAATTGLPFHGLIQIPAILADAGLAVLVALGLRGLGRTPTAALTGAALVALSPCFIIISGYHGQIDSVATLPALGGVLLWAKKLPRRALWAGLLIGLGAATKQPLAFTALALLPTATTHRERLTLVSAVGALPLLSVLPFFLVNPRGTVTGLTANVGVGGFGGISALLAPGLTKYWATLEGPPVVPRSVVLLSDVQNVIVGLAVLLTAAVLIRHRTECFEAAALIWLVVFAVNPNFAFQYLVWGLPFFLLARPLLTVATFSVLASAAALLLYERPVLQDGGLTYFALVQLVWGLLVLAAAHALYRLARRGPAMGDGLLRRVAGSATPRRQASVLDDN